MSLYQCETAIRRLRLSWPHASFLDDLLDNALLDRIAFDLLGFLDLCDFYSCRLPGRPVARNERPQRKGGYVDNAA